MAGPIRLTLHGTILVVILGVLGVMAAAPAQQAYDQHKQVKEQQAKLEALKAENVKLERRLERLNDPEYVEKLAREELGLVRPGEVSYVVVPGPAQTTTVSASKARHRPWYTRMMDWLTKRN